MVAIGALHWLSHFNTRVPEDVAVVGYYNIQTHGAPSRLRFGCGYAALCLCGESPSRSSIQCCIHCARKNLRDFAFDPQ